MGRPEKYVALRTHLEEKAREFRDSGDKELHMTFRQIEGLGVRLPASAYSHRAWWANNQGTGLFASMREAADKPWQRAKFDTADVSMEKGEVTFRYFGGFSHKGHVRQAEARTRQEEENEANRARFRQFLKQRREAATEATSPAASVPKPSRHPLFGTLKGHIRLVAGTDLTKPANPHRDHNKP